LQINVMTCGFEKPTTEINMGEYNFIDIKEGTVAYRPEVIYIDCRQGESGVLELTPGKIEYSFRSASGLKNGQVLANDEELSATGAGEVGFHIQDASGADIQYDNGYLYETPQEAVHGKNPITLNIKPMKYGENVRTGEMKSRVIIVVNNN
jgi:type 1 fimbria pilin